MYMYVRLTCHVQPLPLVCPSPHVLRQQLVLQLGLRIESNALFRLQTAVLEQLEWAELEGE